MENEYSFQNIQELSKEKTNLMPLILLLSSASDCIKTPHRHSHTETERQHTPNQIPPMKTQPVSRRLLKMVVLTAETC